MDALGIIAIVLAVIGIAGGFLPVVPGPPLSWVALLLVYFSESTKDELSVTALVGSLHRVHPDHRHKGHILGHPALAGTLSSVLISDTHE